MIIRAILVAAAIAAAPAAGFAQGAAAPVRVDDACKAEMASMCADKAGKGGAGFRCLADNQAKLGADCAAAIKTSQDRRAKFQAACKADADKLCAGDDAKGGRMIGCLRGKTAELSKPCADLIASMPQPKR